MINEFADKMGCVLRPSGKGVVEVSTPFRLAGGNPIRFYIERNEDGVRMTDNGDILFHLAGHGVDTSGPSAWYEVIQIVGAFGIQVSYTGEITGTDKATEAHNLAIRYLSALLAVAAFERKCLGETGEQADERARSANRLLGTMLEELRVSHP
ncbi:MAG TPA: DUF1828 domain-containing protein [Burkholderiales bacterium]|nr:DUF1828 domain-containing protein [Burkholderiales bacterium]